MSNRPIVESEPKERATSSGCTHAQMSLTAALLDDAPYLASDRDDVHRGKANFTSLRDESM
jgi:hypothetical protein